MKENKEYSILERAFICLASFLMFAIVGAIIRALSGPISIFPLSELLLALLPLTLIFGLTAATLAYIYPKTFNIILHLFPDLGGGS